MMAGESSSAKRNTPRSMHGPYKGKVARQQKCVILGQAENIKHHVWPLQRGRCQGRSNMQTNNARLSWCMNQGSSVSRQCYIEAWSV
eukprot:1041495-Pelagomonas_calceolata.AAC.1